MVVYLVYLLLDGQQGVVGLVAVEAGDALHAYLHQLQDVVGAHLADEVLLERFEPPVDVRHGLFLRTALLELLVLVNAVFDEYLFERDEEELLPQFRPLYLLLAAQQVHGVFGADAQQLAHAEEAGLLVVDDAAVGRHAQLAIGEGVERVDGLVGRHARRQVHLYFHLFGREVVRLAYLDFALLAGADDALDELARGSAVGDFADDKRLVVQFAYLGAYLHHAAPLAVVVTAHVDGAARGEVGIQRERLAAQAGHRGIEQLVEVVGQYLRVQPHGDAFHALHQQQGKLDGQRDGLLVAPVVGEFPLRHLGAEHRFEGKLRKPRFDVTFRRRVVARQDVAPVALRVDKQILLPQLHQRILDGRVAVRVELHGLAHHVGHLVVASVLHAVHGMQNASLHRLQSVVDVGHGALEYHVGGIVQEPVLVHAAQVVGNHIVLFGPVG